ncbi:MAG: CehA/McbA family metallohydrolase [Coriobacteriia bacterium]|nr:CehA/McbA family metallohydrolase [Coriobacteriia bacterium]
MTSWSSADIHLHTTASDGLYTPRQVVEWAAFKTDLSVVAITDHNTMDGAFEAAEIARDLPVELVLGQEIDTVDGHVLALWLNEPVPAGMSALETVDAIHEQGGVAIAAHPFAPKWWAKHGLCRGDEAVYDSVPFDAFEVHNATPLLFHANLRARHYVRRSPGRFAVTGGSDAHILSAIGATRTLFAGSTAADLRRAIESKTTRVDNTLFWLTRNARYLAHVPRIVKRERAMKRDGDPQRADR